MFATMSAVTVMSTLKQVDRPKRCPQPSRAPEEPLNPEADSQLSHRSSKALRRRILSNGIMAPGGLREHHFLKTNRIH